jgi:hypothetical protein
VLLGVAGFASFVIVAFFVLFTVYRMRPELFRFKATVTKWISFDVEMRAPQPPPGEPRSHRRQLTRGRIAKR